MPLAGGYGLRRTRRFINGDSKMSEVGIDYETEEIEGEHEIGIIIEEELNSSKLASSLKVLLGYKRDIVVDGEDGIVFLSIGAPAKIEPDLFYPALEWRLTMETLDGCDFLPQWKSHVLKINGQSVFDEGVEVKIMHYVVQARMDMEEEEDGHFFTDLPFMNKQIKMTDIDLPVVSGSEILRIIKAKNDLAGQGSDNASRRRAE